jgi:hypothetical protein
MFAACGDASTAGGASGGRSSPVRGAAAGARPLERGSRGSPAWMRKPELAGAGAAAVLVPPRSG